MLISVLLTVIFAVVQSAVNNPCTSIETCGALYSKEYLHDVYYSGLRRITKKAKTHVCKQKIEFEFMKHMRALAEESVYPFENVNFETQCKNISAAHPPVKPTGPHVIKLAHNDTLQLMPTVEGALDPDRLSIMYIMLVHNHPEFAVRIINALDEPMHNFVIHVDATADPVQEYLQQTLANRTNIHLVQQGRETISWGGFSIVNATMTAIRYAWNARLHFDYLMDISGTTYPLKSNKFIRKALSESPNSVFMETYPTPVKPEGIMWNQFVECDGALHRITRLAPPRGINMHVSSQWFAVPRHYVHWLLHSALPRDYTHYAQYIIIADENYFATMFHNSPFCQAEIKKTLVFLLFDKWEHERNTTETGKPRDLRKCLGVGENNCGRSPTTLTMDFKNLIGSSRMLFARKFDPENVNSMKLLEFVDVMRNTHGNTSAEVTERWDTNKDDGSVSTMIKLGREEPPTSAAEASVSTSNPTLPTAEPTSSPGTSDQSSAISSGSTVGEGATSTATAAAAETAPPAEPAKCLTYTSASPGYIRTLPCDPSNPLQWFEIGRCTHGYALELHDHACPTFRKVATSSSSNAGSNVAAPPEETKEDVFCSLLTRWENKELCVDIAGENAAYQTPVLGYDCTGRWNQLFKLTENCAIMAEQPGFIGRVRGKGDKSIVSCLDTRHSSGVVLTAECEHLKPVVEANSAANATNLNDTTTDASSATSAASQNGTVEVESSVSGEQTQVLPQEAPAVRVDEGARWQQYQFLPASGEAYKAYMGSSISNGALASMSSIVQDAVMTAD